MILTNCPVCAAPLPPTTAKQCSRCKTRYCGPECQKTHWEEGGHDKLCRKIRKGGGAEQYHASKKYTEAVAVAAEACAEDTNGQTCYICTEAVHRHTKEGLVRGCACHTTEGFVHVSCLAEQAKILVAEGEENNLGSEVLNARWDRWHTCSLCKQGYHGVVKCALGWACWKAYVGRPEEDQPRSLAMSVLGLGLSNVHHHADALPVYEAQLAMIQRLGADEEDLLATQSNLASTYKELGRPEKAMQMRREVYFVTLKLLGDRRIHRMRDRDTLGDVVRPEEEAPVIIAALNYAQSLQSLNRSDEAKSLLRTTLPAARRVLGESHEITLKTRLLHAVVLYKADGATLADLREAVATFEETQRTALRVFGGAHPLLMEVEAALQDSQTALHACEANISRRRDTLYESERRG